MIRISIVAAAVLIAVMAGAQEVVTLDQCREMALHNNIAIRNSRLQSRAASEVRKEAFTKYFPEVSAAGFAFTTDRSVVKYDLDGSVPVPPIPGVLPDGAAFPFSFELSMIKKGIMAGANLVQPVFLGGMIVNGNRLAEVGEAVAELQSRQSEDQVRLTVEQYYWQIAALKGKRETIDKLIATLDTLEHQVDVAVRAGVILRNDLLEVKLRKNDMLTSRIELENGISILSSLLAQYIGKGVEPVEIADNISEDGSVESPDRLYAVPADALYNTVDYKLLKQGVKAADLQRKIVVGEYMPKVAVGAGYFYHNILDQGHGFGALYATVAVPLSGWWGGSHAIRQSKLKAAMARNQLTDASELLQVNMINNWNALNTAYDKISVARQSIAQSAENLRLNENYYHAGTITITDLLKAQTLYRQAHDQFIDAFGEYHIKAVQYLQSTGR